MEQLGRADEYTMRLSRRRRGLARLTVLLVLSGELGLPLVAFKIGQCCLTSEEPVLWLWLALAVGLPLVVFVLWVGVDWVIRGFSGEAPPGPVTIEIPTLPPWPFLLALWPRPETQQGHRLCSIQGFIGLLWTAASQTFLFFVLYGADDIFREKYASGPPLTPAEFFNKSSYGATAACVAVSAIVALAAGIKFRRFAFSLNLLWTLIEMLFGRVLLSTSGLVWFFYAVRLLLAVNGVRGAYGGDRGQRRLPVATIE